MRHAMLIILIMLVMAVTASTYAQTYAQTSMWQYDRWVPRLGDIEVWYAQSTFDLIYQHVTGGDPGRDMMGKLTAAASMNVDADARILTAFNKLCDRDTDVCEAVMATYGLRRTLK